MAHTMGCLWVHLGKQQPCKIDEDELQDMEANLQENCYASWVYANDFEDKSIATQYIFAFYWIFEVITTVGYGDYSGKT